MVNQTIDVGYTISDHFPLDFIYGYSIDISLASASDANVDGAMYLLATNDESKPQSEWAPVDGSTIYFKGDLNHLYNVQWPMYRHVCLCIKLDSGLMTANVNFYCKGM